MSSHTYLSVETQATQARQLLPTCFRSRDTQKCGLAGRRIDLEYAAPRVRVGLRDKGLELDVTKLDLFFTVTPRLEDNRITSTALVQERAAILFAEQNTLTLVDDVSVRQRDLTLQATTARLEGYI